MARATLPRIGIIGLGYVGLPVAVALAERYPGTVGFDINPSRIAVLNTGVDATGEVDNARLKSAGVRFTADIADLKGCGIFIVCVPTPIHADRRPDLEPLRSASEVVGKVLKVGGIVCYESTVYPGVTEEFCGPILARVSGLQQGRDFKLGYSPERINPGDKVHTFETITKIVSGEDEATLRKLAEIYGSVVPAGIHLAPSIKVAEAAKVLENTQRDLNIALMNEFAIICSLLEIRTHDVLALLGELRKHGLSFQITDPHVTHEAAVKVFGTDARLTPWEEAVKGADALCFACGHSLFRDIDLKRLKSMTASDCLFVDGRHSFSRMAVSAAGFEYITI